MAYARLIFPTSATVLQKLKDIVKICSGNTTQISQLEFALGTSTLISLEPAGWILNTQIEATGIATLSEYLLTSPCITTSKNKYCALMARSVPVISGINKPSYVSTASLETDLTGSLFIPQGSSIGINSLENPTWFSKELINASSAGNPTIYDIGGVDLSSNEIYISVTNRKIFVFGSNVTYNGFAGVFEFPETRSTVIFENIPSVQITASIIPTASTAYSRNYITNTINSTLSTTTTYYTYNRAASLCNWYSPIDNQRINRTAEDGLNSLMYLPDTPSQVISSSGELLYPLYPIIDIRTNRFEGLHNYSKLTDIFFTYRSSSYASWGDEITVGTDTYVVLSCGSSTANYRSICIKKA